MPPPFLKEDRAAFDGEIELRLAALVPKGSLILTDALWLAGRLEEAGFGVASWAPGRRGSALVLIDPQFFGRAEAVAARSALSEGGPLLVGLGSRSVVDARGLFLALSEAGFAVRDSERSGRYDLWTAIADRFVVRGYRPGDETAILRLFQASFHVARDLERWRWEYRETPGGGPHASLAFTPDGELTAHYAGYPVRFWRATAGDEGDFLPTFQVGDTMTAAAYRGIGRGPTSLLGRTVRHFYARWCEGRVAFNYGFNTGKIQRFSLRTAGARRAEPVPYRRLDLGGGPPAALRPRPLADRLGGWRLERIRGFDLRFDAFFAAVRSGYGFLAVRDAAALSWRYAACPGTDYRMYAVEQRRRLAGWAVFQLRGDRLVWGDALVDPVQAATATRLLLAEALADAPGAREIVGWLTPRPAWWDRTVRQLGFADAPEPQDLGLVYVPFRVDPTEEIGTRLYYAYGDSDLF